MRISIDAIDEHALTRDRSTLDAAALTELRLSIARTGLRLPIEVFATDTGYGLISGYRRLVAVRGLYADTRQDRYATIEAILREPADHADALAAMIEENEIRESLSPWDRGRICVAARDQGLFDSLDAAVEGLYPSVSRQKRSRLRALANVVEDMDGTLVEPEAWSERRLIRLDWAIRCGWRDLIVTALDQYRVTTAGDQWAIIAPVLTEAEDPKTSPSRPKRLSNPRPGVVIRRERTREGYILHITGKRANDALADAILTDIEVKYGPA